MLEAEVERIVYMSVYTRVYMAKLYWRLKRDGKWTWQAAQVRMQRILPCKKYIQMNLVNLEEEE